MCRRDREQKVAQRLFDELHKEHQFHDGTGTVWSKEFGRETPVRYDDGVTIYVTQTDLAPDDKFLTERKG